METSKWLEKYGNMSKQLYAGTRILEEMRICQSAMKLLPRDKGLMSLYLDIASKFNEI